MIRRIIEAKEQNLGPSFTDGHPEKDIAILELPNNVESVIGRSGLDIRTLDQLTSYSRAFLGQQLVEYENRTVGMIVPRITSIDEYLDLIESKLGMLDLSLAA